MKNLFHLSVLKMDTMFVSMTIFAVLLVGLLIYGFISNYRKKD